MQGIRPYRAELIVTADDFGLNAAVNLGVVRALRDRHVTHASVMVNMPGFEEACDLSQADGLGSRVGVHVNLAEGVPLTDAMRSCAHFCSDGQFNDPDSRRRYAPLSAADIRIVADETRAQIARARRYGFTADHLDSHRFVHSMPNVIGPIVRAARDAGMTRVRPYQNCGLGTRGLKSMGKAAGNLWLRAQGFTQVEYFGSIDDVLSLRQTRGRAITSAEIMTHPIASSSGVVLDGADGPLDVRLHELEALR